MHNEVTAAYTRESQIKKWKRQWKIDLIEKFNPEWEDLFKILTD
jgi:putative endonuclease